MTKPQTLADRYPVVCSETTLTVHQPLPNLDPALADAIRGWLHAHDLDENEVVLATPIERNPAARTLTWTSRPQGTREPSVHVAFDASTEPPDQREPWPAPFPDIVLQQSEQDRCPTCGRSL